MILNPAIRVRVLSGDQYTMRLRSLHRAYPSLHPLRVVHWVPEQLNIKAVTEHGNWLMVAALCCVRPHLQWSSGICHRNKVNSTAWLYRDGPSHKIVSFTLHYNSRQGYSKCGLRSRIRTTGGFSVDRRSMLTKQKSRVCGPQKSHEIFK